MSRSSLTGASRSSTALATVLVCLACFFALAWLVESGSSAPLDQQVVLWAREHRSPWWTVVMLTATALGSFPGVVTAALLASWAGQRCGLYLETVGMWLLLGLATWANHLLKWGFGRPRPPWEPLVQEAGLSFPSAHAMVGAAFYGFLAVMVWRQAPAGGWRLAAAGALLAVVVAICVSRVYLGVHYPTDVAAGVAAGGALLGLCLEMLEEWRRRAAVH